MRMICIAMALGSVAAVGAVWLRGFRRWIRCPDDAGASDHQRRTAPGRAHEPSDRQAVPQAGADRKRPPGGDEVDRGGPQGLQGEDSGAGARRVHRRAPRVSTKARKRCSSELARFEKQARTSPDFAAGQLAAGVYEATLPEEQARSGYQGCVYELAVQLRKELAKAASRGRDRTYDYNRDKERKLSRILRRNKTKVGAVVARHGRADGGDRRQRRRHHAQVREHRSDLRRWFHPDGAPEEPQRQGADHAPARGRDGDRPTGATSRPPNTISLDFDKAGELFTKGLPSCNVGQLESTLTAQAKKICADALVGTGTVKAAIALPEQAPFGAQGPLLIFNGSQGQQAGADPPRLRPRPGADDLRRPGRDQEDRRQVRHQRVHQSPVDRQRLRLGDELRGQNRQKMVRQRREAQPAQRSLPDRRAVRPGRFQIRRRHPPQRHLQQALQEQRLGNS